MKTKSAQSAEGKASPTKYARQSHSGVKPVVNKGQGPQLRTSSASSIAKHGTSK